MFKRAIKNWLSRKGYSIIKASPQDVDSMIPLSLPQHLFENSRVCASREDVLPLLPKGGIIAEVGVAYGNFSALLLEILQPEKFIAIDSYAFTTDNEPWKQTILKESKLSHLEYYKDRFKNEIIAGKVEVHQGLSWDCLAKLPDRSLDYVYLDAGHTYDEVVKDILQLKKKIKDTAIIQFNDYTLFDAFAFVPYGVPKAIHEFITEENLEVLYLCLHRQFFCDLVVRKKTATPFSFPGQS
ncbi:MAG: class I SAM-dependent methyltransferase [Bacteroidetes bacterium]|nr:class I SAM-dependent methyltransferase [Bacteroidota bacterium]